MGDAGGDEVLIDGQLGGHDDVVGGGKDGVHSVSNQGTGGGDDLVVGVSGGLGVGHALGVQISLGIRDGHLGIGLGQGVEQAHRPNVRILGKHHVQNLIGVQGIAGAGDVVHAGELHGLRIGDGGEDHRGLALLSGDGGHLGGGGGDGDNGVHTVGNGLVGQLAQDSLIALAGGHLILDRDAVFLRDGVQPGGNRVGDLVQGGVIHLLDHGHLIGFTGGGSGSAGLHRLPLRTAGREGQGQRGRGGERQDSIQLFHVWFLPIKNWGGRWCRM